MTEDTPRSADVRAQALVVKELRRLNSQVATIKFVALFWLVVTFVGLAGLVVVALASSS